MFPADLVGLQNDYFFILLRYKDPREYKKCKGKLEEITLQTERTAVGFMP